MTKSGVVLRADGTAIVRERRALGFTERTLPAHAVEEGAGMLEWAASGTIVRPEHGPRWHGMDRAVWRQDPWGGRS